MRAHARNSYSAARHVSVLIATVLVAAFGGSGWAADVRHHGPRWQWTGDIGVDALALIEWWEERAYRERLFGARSSAHFRADSRTLLLYCGPAGSLVYSVAPLGPDGRADRERRAGIRCAADEALYGDAQGSLHCTPFAGRIGTAMPRPVEILVGVGEPLAIVGVCLGGDGAVTAAYVPELLEGSRATPVVPCPTTRSSTTFRGSKRTGDCGL